MVMEAKTMREDENRSIKKPKEAKEGFFGELYNNLKLILRLIRDKRVSFLLKLLPIGALIYLVVPLDVFPINPIDDAMIMWLGGYLFIELCPPDVVKEHLRELRNPVSADPTVDMTPPDVVDADFKEADSEGG
jgi:uncharacterized membrane protein YkvA (DUF1232 family)